MWWTMIGGMAMAADLAPVSEASSGVTAVAVKDLAGAVRIVGEDTDEIRVTGSVEEGEAKIQLRREGGVVTVTVKGHRPKNLELEVHVPRSMEAVTVYAVTGPVSARGVSGALAVVSNTGPVEVRDAGSLRVQRVLGPLTLDGVGGDVVVDGLTGAVSAADVGGDLTLDGVVGPVKTGDVGGELIVRGGTPILDRL
ncbi:MAG: hypothetical protein H6738_24355 [Alphaproteobacteria bacterium]|nr:hypothetical protein [Alphaproteobacteria bacterium]MCB9699942.1 hypothetical protein [Alphaproteobacteria bacterium]